MVYENVKKTNIDNIRHFMNIYGFPPNKIIESIFARFNAGEPVGFTFLIDRNGVFEEGEMTKLLSFNITDDYEIFSINEGLNFVDTNKVYFAIDNNEDYICCDMHENKIYIYSEVDDIFYDVYIDRKELYTMDSFFDDMDG